MLLLLSVTYLGQYGGHVLGVMPNGASVAYEGMFRVVRSSFAEVQSSRQPPVGH